MLYVSTARPWALALGLGLRDALGIVAADIPRTSYRAASPAPPASADVAESWQQWWRGLIGTCATPAGLAALNDRRTAAGLPALEGSLQAATPIVAEVEPWATRWRDSGVPASPPGVPGPLLKGVARAGFQTPSGRRRARRQLGRALPDDAVVAVLPVPGVWAGVTAEGLILVSDDLAADSELAQRWFETFRLD